MSTEADPRLQQVYVDLHAHPELSHQERRTAGVAAAWLREHGYIVHEGVGGHDVHVTCLMGARRS